jgi:hypothetical protein
MTQVPKAPDFKHVEALRKHMLLTVTHMAKLLDVSRITYSGWVNGKAIRKTNIVKVRRRLKQMLAEVETGWPQPEVIAMTGAQRAKVLLERLSQVT